MAHGVSEVLAEGTKMQLAKHQQHQQHQQSQSLRKTVGVMGSRRIFAPAFKLKVLDSYRHDIDCRGNQRATARKYGIHRRQIQKWLQCEENLRSCCTAEPVVGSPQKETGVPSGPSVVTAAAAIATATATAPASPALNLSLARLHGDEPPPPPPPPPPQEAQAQPQQPYRFHASVGYPDPKDNPLPIHSVIYPPMPTFLPAYPPFDATLEPSRVPTDEEHRPRTLLASGPIKTERASPDSPCDAPVKRERPDDEEREAVASSDSSVSPLPVVHHHEHHQHHQHHHHHRLEGLESLPPSPRDSERSGGSCSSDSEMESQNQHPGVDLARRRSFSLRFKLQVLDAFHRDAGVAGNQRATARKFGINRRQVQKWLGQETELRGVIELCGSESRQRLGPVQEGNGDYETPVDLRTVTACDTDSPPYECCDYAASSSSPSNYVDSSLTPPYSGTGCSLPCCQEQPTGQSYLCYSPGDSGETTTSLKRARCTQACCYPPAKKLCYEETAETKEDQAPIQETPLCLVKPKRIESQQVEPVSSTVPTPPAPSPPTKKDGILFKPYLDNPVSKPSAAEDNAINNNNNNNCQEACNLNDRPGHDLALELSFRLPVNWRVHQPPRYLEFPQAPSAFVRYPASVRYDS